MLVFKHSYQIKRKREKMHLLIKIMDAFLFDQDVIIVFFNDTTLEENITRLTEINSYKTQILASVSHELRTPLNCTMGLLQSAKEEMNFEGSLLEKYVLPALGSSKLLLFMINDILDFS